MDSVGMGVRATVLALLLLFIASFCDCQSITLEPRPEVVELPGFRGLNTFTSLICTAMPVNVTVAAQWILPNGTTLNSTSGRFFSDQDANTGELDVVLGIALLSYQDAGDYTCEVMDQSEPGAQWIPATVQLQLTVSLQALEREVTASTTDSEAVLRCEMTDYIRPDESLQWFRGEQPITYGGRHTIVYEDGTPFRALNGGSNFVPGRVSVLNISDPVVTDSGVYTCQIQGTAVSADIQLSITGNSRNLGPIIGGAVAGFLVAALVTLGLILAIIITRRRTTDLSLELQSKVSNQTSDQAALTHFQRSEPDNIETSRNVAYVSSADAIPASRNEAYGITNVVTIITTQNEAYSALQSGDRGEQDHDYVINQLSYEEAGDQYDYVHS